MANNPYTNKVQLADGTTLIDLTGDTVTANDVRQGVLFHLPSGEQAEGVASAGSTIVVSDTIDEHGGTIRTITAEVLNLQAKSITPTTSQQIINPDEDYNGLSQVVVGSIPSQYIVPTGNVTLTQNGTGIDVSSYATATVNVAGQTINNQDKTVTPTTSTQTVTADSGSGYTGLGTVTVNPIPSQYIVPSGTKSITANGTGIDVTSYASVDVNVSSTINNQNKTVTPSESEQTINADAGYSGLGTVTVEAVSDTYIGSAIDQRDSTDLTASGATVTVPAGYYEEQASKSIAAGSASTPATSITANPSISVSASGLITATASASQSVTPTVSAGYVSAGTAGTVSVSGSNTQQLTTQAAKTVTPTESEQNAVAAGVYTTGIVKVGAISSTYVGSGITQRDGDDLTASGATVTVPAGYYAEQATKSVASGSATAPASITGTAATVSTGTNTLTLTKTVSVTPSVSAGYVSSGTAGNSSVSLTASVTTKSAATYYPSTSDQTISASQYLTGAQTIKAVTYSGLNAANIASGVTVKIGDSADDDRIVSVTGTLAFQTYYTGSGTPSSSLGSDGDIYLQTS